ncbi:MAG: pentapeptide repeat-containing protein, partial [Crocosphaera sp.]
WFYGIGLSDSHIFDTRNLCVTFRGDKDKPNYLAIFIVKYEHKIFTTFDIIDRLKYALLSIDSSNQELHINEYYRDNWDDEHLSRLIVTGRAISHKADPHKKKGNKKKVKEINDFIKNNHQEKTDENWLFSLLNKWSFLITIIQFLKKHSFWVSVSVMVGILVIILESQMLALPPKSILSIVLIILFLVISVVSFSKYQWSGFQNKKFWDWLELLFVPIILTLGVFFLEVQAESRQERLELLKQEQQAMTEYVKNVKDVIKVTNNSEDDQLELSLANRKLIEAFTKIILLEISPERKRRVIAFLHELGLINLAKNNISIIELGDANLTNAKLNDLNLSNTNFRNTELIGVDFTGTNLSRASFRGTKINNVNIDFANLQYASIRGAEFSNEKEREKWYIIQNIHSRSQRGNQSDFKEFKEFKNPNSFCKEDSIPSSLNNVYLGKNLSNVFLENSDLKKADFKDIDLTGSTFKNSDLEGADLRGAKLSGVNWERVYLNNVIIDQQGFETLDLKTKLVYSIFNKPEIFDKPQKFKNMYQKFKNPHIFANFFRVANNNDKESNTQDGIDLTNSVLRCAKFSLTLNNNNSKLNMSNVDMSQSDLTAAEFNNTNLKGAKFTGADMKYIDMIDVNLEDASLFVADLTGAKIKGSLKDANLNSAIVIGADLSEVTGLDKADLYGVMFDEKTKFPKDTKTEKQENGTLNIKIYSGQRDSYTSYQIEEVTYKGKTFFTIFDPIEEEETNVK